MTDPDPIDAADYADGHPPRWSTGRLFELIAYVFLGAIVVLFIAMRVVLGP